MDKDTLDYLVAKAQEEGNVPGPAQHTLGNEFYRRGFELAKQCQTDADFAAQFDAKIVGAYVGPWFPKAKGFDGAEAAVKVGLSQLTVADIAGVRGSYYSQLPVDGSNLKYFFERS